MTEDIIPIIFGCIVPALIGVVCIVLGISNSKGNISSLHSYHRSRVKDEDILPFGKMIGRGLILIGIAIVMFSLLSVLTVITTKEIYVLIGLIVLSIGFIFGIILCLRATKKYNGGIF